MELFSKVQASGISVVDQTTTPDTVTSLLLITFLCLSCVVFVAAFISSIYYYVRKRKIESSDEYVQDHISKIWFRTILITPKGIFVLILFLFGMMVSMTSIQFSILATPAIFFFIIFIILYLYTILINLYLIARRAITGKNLVKSHMNFNSVVAGDNVKNLVKLDVPFPIGYLLKMSIFLPPELGTSINETAFKKEDSFVNFSGTIPRSKRGDYKIGPVVVDIEDIFGLTRIRLIDSTKHDLEILPKVQALKKLKWSAPTTRFGDDKAVKRILNNDDFFDLREYRRGDDIKRIHWKATAKTDKFMLRTPEKTFVEVGNFRIVLNNKLPGDSKTKLNIDMEGTQKILDRMIEIAMSITDYALKHNSQVEFYYLKNYKTIQKLVLKGKNREKILKKMLNVKWIYHSSNMNKEFYKLISTEENQGLFLITSEISEINNGLLIDSVHNKESVNLLYLDASSFYKVEKKRRLEKVFFAIPYLDQFSKITLMYQPKKEYKKFVNEKFLEKIKERIKKSKNLLGSHFNDMRTFTEETNFINELER